MKYNVGDKVEYCYRSKGGHYYYAHGYIKAIWRRLFSNVYVINKAKDDDVHICSEKRIFNKLERPHERVDGNKQKDYAAK